MSLGYETHTCGDLIARCTPPAHYAHRQVTLEPHTGGRWTITDDDWNAAPVGLGHGDHRLHICDRKPEDGTE